MNYSLNDFNHYIETEKCKCAVLREHFKTVAMIDFLNTPHDEFFAETEICKHIKELHNILANVSSYHEFRRMFESGLIDIVHLTSRQKLMFPTCLSD